MESQETKEKESKEKEKGRMTTREKGEVTNPDAGKQCGNSCGKFGHVAKNCWWKISSVGNAEKGSQQNTAQSQSSGGSSTVGAGVRPATATDTCWSTPELVRTARHGDFVAPIQSSEKKSLFGVQGNPLKVYGKKSQRSRQRGGQHEHDRHRRKSALSVPHA